MFPTKRLHIVVLATSALTLALVNPAAAGAAASGPTSLDPSFGTSGVATVPLAPSGLSASADAVGIQSNGDLIVGGESGSGSSIAALISGSSSNSSAPPPQIVVGRLTPSGAKDTTFGSGGLATLPIPVASATDAFPTSVAVQSDGSIVLSVQSVSLTPGGATTAPDLTLQGFLMRLTPQGALDSTFGTGGEVAVRPSSPEVEAEGVALDSLGNVLVTGLSAPDQNSQGSAFVARFTKGGAPDTTFGAAGAASPVGTGVGTAVVGAPSGEVVVGGDTPAGLSLWGFTAAGAVDTAFGKGGQALLPLAPLTDLRSLLALPDGSTLAVGDFGGQAIVAKFDGKGHLVPAFGDGGLTGVGLSTPSFASGGALQANGDIVVGGSSGGLSGLSGQPAGWVARFNPDGTPDRTFAPDGAAALDVTSTSPSVSADLGPVIANGDQPAFGGTTQLDLASLTTPAPQQMGALRLVGGSGPAIPPADAATRLAGPDRIGTAIAISVGTFLPGDSSAAPTAGQATAGGVVVASADDFPDALVGTPLAASLSAPLLLTHADTLDSRVAGEISRVLGDPGNGGEVTVLGGPAAISDAVVGQIADLGYTVRRIGGTDRFDTSVQVAQDILSGFGTPTVLAASRHAAPLNRLAAIEDHRSQVRTAAVKAAAAQQSSGALADVPILEATGTDFPDGVTAGAAAAHIGGVVLLTNGSQQTPAVSQFLLSSGSAERFAVGGPAAGADPGATAIVGGDRYDTAAKVAEAFFVTPSRVAVATGTEFADALAGGSRAAEVGEPVLLTDSAVLSAPTAAYLTPLAKWIDLADVFGGVAAVGNNVFAAIQAAVRG